MLAFSNVLNQYGGYLRENSPVVITGRLSLRDNKEPQIVINRARPISDYADGEPELAPPPQKPRDNPPPSGTLYLRLPSESGTLFPKVRAMLNMFPGNNGVVVYFADSKQRRGSRCALADSLLRELTNTLGKGNVVVK